MLLRVTILWGCDLPERLTGEVEERGACPGRALWRTVRCGVRLWGRTVRDRGRGLRSVVAEQLLPCGVDGGAAGILDGLRGGLDAVLEPFCAFLHAFHRLLAVGLCDVLGEL